MENLNAIAQISAAITNQQGKLILVVIAVGFDGYAYQLENEAWVRLPALPADKCVSATT